MRTYNDGLKNGFGLGMILMLMVLTGAIGPWKAMILVGALALGGYILFMFYDRN